MSSVVLDARVDSGNGIAHMAYRLFAIATFVGGGFTQICHCGLQVFASFHHVGLVSRDRIELRYFTIPTAVGRLIVAVILDAFVDRVD